MPELRQDPTTNDWVIIAGLLPIMWGIGTGSEVMKKNAAPACRRAGRWSAGW